VRVSTRAIPNYVRTLLGRLGRGILDARRTRLVERCLRGFIGVAVPIGIVFRRGCL